MGKEHRNFDGLSLIGSEKIEAELDTKVNNRSFFQRNTKDTFIITNKRIINVTFVPRANVTTMIGMGDIEGVSIRVNKKSLFSLLWGLLGIIGGGGLYYVLESSFNNTMVAVFIGFLSILLGLVLVVDFIVSRQEEILTIYSGSLKLKINIPHNQSKDSERFINKIFEMKTERSDKNIYPLPWPRF